ncbi:MAG TPA: hypothetical protein VLW85_00255 [Myxococcales bacterium]|nr:hypothetical protein [Myxococcales bacterium]
MRLVKFALPALFVAALALLVARAWTDQADAAAQKLWLEHARSQFSQRAAVVRAAPDTPRYRDDQRALLRAWFADLAEIGNRFPALRGQPAAFVPPPPKVRGGSLRDWQDLSDAQVAAWREGRLDLLESAQSQGLRLDLLRVTRVEETQPKLEADVAVWGAPEETQVDEPETGKQVQRVSVPLVFRGLSLRFLDAKGAAIARLDGGGEPALRLDVPERLTPDAPPGLVLGRFELPLFPPDAAEVEWTLAAQVRSTSGEARAVQAVWKTQLDPAWAGGAWTHQADEKVVAETAPQPPEAPKAKHAAWPIRE